MAVRSSRVVFKALREVARAREPVSAAEVAKRLAIPVTTAARALSTLEAAGYAERTTGAARFVPGKSGQRLAYAFMAQFPIRDLALPYLQQLTLQSGHSSSLFIRLGWYATRIALIAGPTAVVNLAPLGAVRPLASGAPSLAMLAQLGEPEAIRAIERHTATNTAPVLRICERIRRQGYAYEVSLLESGGYDLAFPLADATRSTLGAVALEGLNLAAEDARIRIDQARDIVVPLQQVLAEGSAALMPHYDHIDPDTIAVVQNSTTGTEGNTRLS